MANKKTIKKKNYLSHTQCQVGRCPKRYDMIYNKGEYKQLESLPLILGKFSHKFAEDYVNHCIKNKVDGDPEIMDTIFQKLWTEYKIPESEYKELYEECLIFAEKNVNIDSVLDTEKRFHVEFAPGKFVDGIRDLDRIYGFRGLKKKTEDNQILTIIDYKRTAKILKKEETLTDQLKIYTLSVYEDLPKFPYYRRAIYYLKYNIIVAYEDEDNPTPLQDIKIEVEETRDMLLRDWEKLKEAKEFPAIAGEWCYEYGGCPMLQDGSCPKIQKVVDFKDIEGTIRKALQMNTQLKELKKIIEAYIDSNGNVKVDGKEIGYEETEKITYDFEPAYNFCKELVYDLSKEKFPSTIMNKVIKEIFGKINEDDLKKAIDSFKTVTPSTKFKLI
jgi:hypothetical protein